MRMWKPLAWLGIVCALTSLALAESPTTAPAPARTPHPVQVVALSLTPATMPSPALRYTLLPKATDLTEGNAALLYYPAAARIERGTEDDDARIEQWFEMPPDQLPRDEVRKFLENCESSAADLRSVTEAARRERAEWGLPLRTQGFAVQLPHLQGMRRMAKLLSLQARLQLADGRFEQAGQTLQTLFAMARQLDEQGIAIQMLVGAGVAGIALDDVKRWSELPGSPNLYWALANLPDPYFNTARVMDMERAAVDYSIPQLAIARKGELTDQQLESAIRQIYSLAASQQEAPDPQSLASKDHRLAKRHLIATGMAPEKVESMPMAQAVGRYWVDEFDYWHEELSKGFGLPVPQGVPTLLSSQQRYERAMAEPGAHPLSKALIPSPLGIRLAAARVDRTRAALQCVQAIRAYMAAHEGRLPATLSEVTEVPVPLDPFTGQAFIYRMEGRAAVLELPAPAGTDRYAARYELTVRP